MTSEVKMPVVDRARELAFSMRHSGGQWMVPGWDGYEVAGLIEELLRDRTAAIEAARVEARAKALEEAAAEFDRRDNGCGYYEPGEPAEIVRSLAKEAS